MIWILLIAILFLGLRVYGQGLYIDRLADQITELEEKMDKPYKGISDDGYPYTMERK